MYSHNIFSFRKGMKAVCLNDMFKLQKIVYRHFPMDFGQVLLDLR